MTHRTIAVVGAGIIGTLAAHRLLRDGHKVLLIDPHPPGSGASSGNAGCFSPSSIVPLSLPGMVRSIPSMLLNPSGPLALRWSYLPRAAPWLLRFIRAGNMDQVERTAHALYQLNGLCLPTLMPLLKSIGALTLVEKRGSLVVYSTAESWNADRVGRELRRRSGVVWDELSREALLELEPDLCPALHAGLYFPDNGHTIDPHLLVTTLAEAFTRAGGTIITQEVKDLVFDRDRLRAVATPESRLPCDIVVVAAGAFSRALAKKAGTDVPLETERGYHAMVEQPNVVPKVPVLDATAKFVASPMTQGLRLTGTVEFAGLSAAPDWNRARSLFALAQQLFPALATDRCDKPESLWMGHRPSLPDSLPVIGWSRRSRQVALAFGHGHLGLTGAPMTATVLSDLIGGRPSRIDLSPYSPHRF